MPQVNFKIGKSTNLSSVPLTNGTIYFTEDTRRLYIDTATARIPIAGDSMCGKIFWVYLPASDWAESSSTVTTYTQTISTAYEEEEGSTALNISDMLTEDSIIFIGRTTYGSADEDGTYPAIVSTASTASTITFSTFAVGTSTEAPTEDLWVQIYTPNPSNAAYSTVTAITSVYTARMYLYATSWTTDSDGVSTYTLTFDNMDLSSMPYMVNLSDDSLENFIEFADIIDVTESYDSSTGASTLTFSTTSSIDFNIAVDVCIVITSQGTTSVEGEWVQLEIPTKVISNNNYLLTQSGGLLADVDGDREFVIYLTNTSDASSDVINFYSNITDVTYDGNGSYTVTFTDDIDSITEAFSITIIQLNNISTIYDVTLAANDWVETTINEITYYMQAWPDSTSSTKLTEKYLPLAYPASSDYFNAFENIIETKVYSGKMYFYTDVEMDEDIEIKIVDFV